MIELDAALQAVGAPLMVLDPEGRILIWNHACTELTGLGFEEVRGRCPWDCLAPPEDAPRAKERFEQALTEHGVSFLEGYVIDKAGHRHLIEWAHHVVRRADGGVDFVPAIGVDRTPEQSSDDEQRISQSVVEGAGDAILAIDERQKIVVYNECAARVFGWARAEAMGKRLDLLIPALQYGSAPSEPSAICLLARRKSGEEFPIDATISELEVDGTRLCTIVLRDCTQQKRLEREQQFLGQLGKALCTATELSDIVSNVAELSVRFLADCCTIYWLDEHDALHTTVVHADPNKSQIANALERVHLNRAQKQLARAALDQRRPNAVFEMARDQLEELETDEEYRSLVAQLEAVAYVGLPLVARDKGVGAIVLMSSNYKRSFGPEDVVLGEQLAVYAAVAIDRALLHRAALHAAEMHKHVLSVVAHDLRNPIGAARLAIQRLIRDESSERRQFHRKTLELALRALDRLSRLVQDLLLAGQVESGCISLERAPITPDEILSEVMEAFAPTAAAASLRIETKLKRPLPRVLADKHRIDQVFSNLVGNAIKFTPPGGRIWLGAERGERGEVRFWVRDTGRGILPEEVPHVFDRFWQARSARRRGIGLGLDIARGIVTAHGGRIWVESTPEAGSTFYFTLPAVLEERRKGSRRQQPATSDL
jgi:PAS domain S-box-containing protein